MYYTKVHDFINGTGSPLEPRQLSCLQALGFEARALAWALDVFQGGPQKMVSPCQHASLVFQSGMSLVAASSICFLYQDLAVFHERTIFFWLC